MFDNLEDTLNEIKAKADAEILMNQASQAIQTALNVAQETIDGLKQIKSQLIDGGMEKDSVIIIGINGLIEKQKWQTATK